MRLALVLVLAVALAGCGSDDTTDDAASTQPVTVTVTETETVATAPEVECSTAGLRLTLPEQELPGARWRTCGKRVFDAAVARDYDTLEEIALEQGEGSTFSYGAAADAGRATGASVGGGRAGAEPLPMRDAGDRSSTMPFTRNESRLVRLADRVRRGADRRGVAGARRRGPVHPGAGRLDEGGRELPRLPHGDHAGGRLAVFVAGIHAD